MLFVKSAKKLRPPDGGRGSSEIYSSTTVGTWPVWGSSFSSTSAVFSFSVLVQIQGWQEKYGAS